MNMYSVIEQVTAEAGDDPVWLLLAWDTAYPKKDCWVRGQYRTKSEAIEAARNLLRNQLSEPHSG